MPTITNTTKRNVNVKPAKAAKPASVPSVPAAIAKHFPVTTAALAATSKPATTPPVLGPVAGPAKPPVVPAAPSASLLPVVTIPAGVNRTAATIAAGRCSFGGNLSERDTAYLAFYARFAKATGGAVIVADIARTHRADTTILPAYAGSNKPHDAGVFQRLAKAGMLVIHDNGHRATFTPTGTARAEYTKATPVKLA